MTATVDRGGNHARQNHSDTHVWAIVRDDSLTRGLGDIEARMLIDWLVGWAELLSLAAKSQDAASELVARLVRRGRAIARFVRLWARPETRASAGQLAAAMRFTWPMPVPPMDPADVMHAALSWERANGDGWTI